MSKSSFFSIITASYNSEETISRTIQSVLDLDFLNFEYIIVDGNSSDKTVELIQSFIPKFKDKGVSFHYISEKDEGIYDAWNKGIKLSSGEWISFLGSDDSYLPNALSLYHSEIIKQPQINYISSQLNLTNAKNEVITVFGKKYIWDNVIRDINIAQVGSFHKRELFEKVGMFSTKYKIVGDLDFYIRCKDFIVPGYFEKVTGNMQNGGVSNQVYTALKEALDVKTLYGYLPKYKNYYQFYSSLIKCYIKIALNKK